MQVTYDHFQSRQQESCEEALRVARDAHHQVLVAAALLEVQIERLSYSITCGQSSSHRQLGSHQHSCSRICKRSHRRHPPVSQQEQIPSVVSHNGNSAKRQASSSSPSDPGGGSPLRNIALDGVPQLGLGYLMEVSWQKETLVLTLSGPRPWTLPGRAPTLAGSRRLEGPLERPAAQTSPWWPLWVDWVAWSMCGHASLVEGVLGDLWHRGPLGIFLKSEDLLWGAYGMVPIQRREKWLLQCNCPEMYWKG